MKRPKAKKRPGAIWHNGKWVCPYCYAIQEDRDSLTSHKGGCALGLAIKSYGKKEVSDGNL